MLVGLLAGLAAFGFARWKGEPSVDKAIAVEKYLAAQEPAGAGGHSHEVSRAVQGSAGLGTGTIIFGVAMGGLFALVFTVAYGRLGLRTARGTAATLGVLAFVGIYVVPWLKYPPNPPAVGLEDTIGRRTVLYLVMIVLSVAAIVVGAVVRRRLVPRFGALNSTLMIGAGYLVVMGICFAALPGVNEVPQLAIPGVIDVVADAVLTFPSSVLWDFRIASLGVQAVTWTVIAVAFGPLAERVLEADHGREPSRSGWPSST
jgi:hypothetical protein